jgi:hypothetical protein
MESKQLIQTLQTLAGKVENIQKDIESIKLELARNERVTKLEAKMAGMEVKVWVLFGALVLIASAFVGFYFKNNG